MKPYLLDINVLIALAWHNHVHHEDAQRSFARKGAAGFRTCPITQTGFVGISSNPAFTPQAVTPGEALDLLDRITQLPGHDFWFDDLPLRNAVAPGTLLGGHRQVKQTCCDTGSARSWRLLLWMSSRQSQQSPSRLPSPVPARVPRSPAARRFAWRGGSRRIRCQGCRPASAPFQPAWSIPPKLLGPAPV